MWRSCPMSTQVTLPPLLGCGLKLSLQQKHFCPDRYWVLQLQVTVHNPCIMRLRLYTRGQVQLQLLCKIENIPHKLSLAEDWLGFFPDILIEKPSIPAAERARDPGLNAQPPPLICALVDQALCHLPLALPQSKRSCYDQSLVHCHIGGGVLHDTGTSL